MSNSGSRPDRGGLVAAVVAAVFLLPATAVMAFASLGPLAGCAVTAIATAAHGALLWRRTAATTTLLAVTALLGTMAAVTGLFVLFPSTLLLLVALHAAAAHGDMRVAIGIGLLAPIAAAVRYGVDPSVAGSGFGPAPWLLGILVLALCAAVIAMGLLRRSERCRADLVAGQLELERKSRADREAHAAAVERARISRDLHDVLAHSLTVIVGQARVARFTPAQADAAIEAIETAARESLRDLRQALRTLQADDADCAPTPTLADLPALAERMRSLGLAVDRQSAGTPRPLGAAVELALYRAVQEGLTNALRHGGGSLEWEERWEQNRLMIELRNPVPDVARPSHGAGLGLRGLKERLASVGGTIEIDDDPCAFTLRASVPYTATGVRSEWTTL